MSYQDFIPRRESSFHIWQGVLVAVVDANATVWLIPTDKVTALKALQTDWVTAYTKASNHMDRTTTDVQAKNDALKVYKMGIRKFVPEYLAYNSKVTDAERRSMGLTIRNGQRTPSSTPETSPVAEIDISKPMIHSIYITDSGTGEKAKPLGVHGCEIWVKVGGEEPKTGSEYSFLATDTKGPYEATYDVADIGKRIWYRFRWINKIGQTGPWSRPFSAVVGG